MTDLRESMRRILMPEALDADITQAERTILGFVRSLPSPKLSPEDARPFVQYAKLLVRAARLDADDEGNPDPQQFVNAIADLYTRAAGERAGDPEDIQLDAYRLLNKLGLVTRLGMLARDADKKSALQIYTGQVYQYQPYREEEENPEPETFQIGLGTETETVTVPRLSFGHMNSIKFEQATPEDYIMPSVLLGSDYSGDTLHYANYFAFLVEFGEVEGVAEVYGGYDTRGVAIRLNTDPEDESGIWEMLYNLDGYPVVSDDAVSAIESEAEYAAWNDWGHDDFIRELEKKFEGYDFSDADPDDILELFRGAQEKSNTYWEPQSGTQMWIRMEDILEVITTRDIIEVAGVGFPEEEVEVAAGAGPRTKSR